MKRLSSVLSPQSSVLSPQSSVLSPQLSKKTWFTAFQSQMSRKSQHTHFEDKIQDQVSFWGFPATCAMLLGPTTTLQTKNHNFCGFDIGSACFRIEKNINNIANRQSQRVNHSMLVLAFQNLANISWSRPMTLLRRVDLRNPRTMHVRGFSCVTYHPPTTTSLFHVGTFTIEVTKKQYWYS